MRPVTQKTRPFRSEKYTRWVQKLPCSVCSTDQAIHPHHLKGHGHGGTRKADDRLTMPLCHEHHHELHHYGHQRFDNRYRTMSDAGQIYYLNLTLGRAKIAKVLTKEQISEARGLIKT